MRFAAIFGAVLSNKNVALAGPQGCLSAEEFRKKAVTVRWPSTMNLRGLVAMYGSQLRQLLAAAGILLVRHLGRVQMGAQEQPTGVELARCVGNLTAAPEELPRLEALVL
jgi:hypothetical protein